MSESALKLCPKCDREFPVESFPFQNKALGRRHARCRECWNAYQRDKQRNPEVVAKRKAVRDSGGWKDERARSLRRYYNLSMAQYEAMSAAQGNACAICQDPPKRQSLHVDHCHSTGEVRGLLCGPCNRALGGFKDSVSALRAAAEYLERSRGTERASPVPPS